MKILLTSIATPSILRKKIMDMGKKNGLTQPCFEKMLDYTIDIFESNGLGTAYYGYHNIDHELEVTLGTLLVCGGEESIPELSNDDLKYLYVSALFHDFDPEKSVDKPHEENVLKSISLDPTIKDLIIKAGIDFEIIKVLILRTVYPWEGDLRERAEKEIEKCFQISEITKDNPEKQKHYLWLGWLLSIIDRVTGYALGDFSKALHLAKMNSHASAWNPALMIKRSVMYFEGLIGGESNMCEMVLRCLPKHMRKNFMQNVQEFMKLRQKEIQIQSDFLYDNLKLVSKIESMPIRKDKTFVDALHSIYLELPRPLRLEEKDFGESINDSDVLLNTVRLGNTNGPIIGFAKGGPLENYKFRVEISDENHGKRNTMFLEPIALKMGYWGLGGGHMMRQLFLMQAHTMKYEFLTSFALRDVIEKRTKSFERAEFVTKFDPERWDYYRIKL